MLFHLANEFTSKGCLGAESDTAGVYTAADSAARNDQNIYAVDYLPLPDTD